MKAIEKIYRVLVLLCGPVLWIGLAVYLFVDITVRPTEYGLYALAMIPTAMMYLFVGSLSGYVAMMVWRRHRWAIILSLIGVFFVGLLAMFYVMSFVQAEGVTAASMIIGGLALCATTLVLAMQLLRHVGQVNVESRVALTPYFIVLAVTVSLLTIMILPIGTAFSLGEVPSAVWGSVLGVVIAGFVWMIIGVYRKNHGATVTSMICVPIVSLLVILAYSWVAPAIGIALWASAMAIFLVAGNHELKQRSER